MQGAWVQLGDGHLLGVAVGGLIRFWVWLAAGAQGALSGVRLGVACF